MPSRVGSSHLVPILPDARPDGWGTQFNIEAGESSLRMHVIIG